MPNNTDASLSGKGSDIMLPSRGNPFAGQTDSATPDLSPEDVAAMFKESLPSEAMPPSADTEPVTFGITEEAPATFAATAPIEEKPAAPAETASTVVVTNTTTVATEVASAPANPTDPPTGSTSVVAATTTAVAVTGDQPGVRAAVAGGVELRVSSAEIGPSDNETYVRSAELPADEALVNLLVPEDKLMILWLEIDALEKDIASANGVGRLGKRTAEEFIDRLTTARNLLMNRRDQFEDANREVVTVRYRLTRIRKTSLPEDPRIVIAYLVVLLALLIIGFTALDRIKALMGNPETLVGIPVNVLWNTILWGGLGGVSAALWSLVVRHVDDYDPHYARWYYLSPLQALIFGPLIALLAQIGLPAMVQLASSDPVNMSVNPVVLYVLAWVVGFQQNLLLKLINYVLERIFPVDSAKDKSKPPAADK